MVDCLRDVFPGTMSDKLIMQIGGKVQEVATQLRLPHLRQKDLILPCLELVQIRWEPDNS